MILKKKKPEDFLQVFMMHCLEFEGYSYVQPSNPISNIYVYYRDFLDLEVKHLTGFILESSSWRANKDWGYNLGCTKKELINYSVISFTVETDGSLQAKNHWLRQLMQSNT